ncbi:hypothetical protein ACMXYR_03055 [Neptuniibacter sp. QD29_5]|uniref:hypothetical protein n=1 Tax=Neptuniibacter sp. QD29_5 TaxID=3398207 RepID=UPI0039F503D9
MLYLRALICTALVTFSASAQANEHLEKIPDWLLTLPESIEQLESTGKTSSIYLKNYMQCMDDQQALNQKESPTVGQVIDNALDASNECAPLLNDMLDEIKDSVGSQTPSSDNQTNKSL